MGLKITTPSQVSALINQIYEKLNQLEQEIQEVLQILRPLLKIFPDNSVLIQIFATLNNFQFFGSNRRITVENIANRISQDDASGDVVQEAGEEPATFLGKIVEARTNVNNIRRRLEILL